jgi:hypothetical protein
MDVFKLSTSRSGFQAVGFYFCYLILFIMCGGLVGAIACVISGGGFDTGLRAGQVFAILACPSLAIAILKAKRKFTFGYVVLALLSGVLAVYGGAILGMIPVSFLTTRNSGVADPLQEYLK